MKRGQKFGDRVWDGYRFVSEQEWIQLQARSEELKKVSGSGAPR